MHIAADFQGQIPWTYSRWVIDLEGIAEKCDEWGLLDFLGLEGHIWWNLGSEIQGGALDLH